MLEKSLLSVLAASVGVSAPLAAAQPAAPAEQETSIPLFRYRLTNFVPIDRDTVYLRSGGRWYRAETFGPCLDLPWARAIGVDTRGSGSINRFSTLIVEGDRCQLSSLVRSEPPPRRQRRRR